MYSTAMQNALFMLTLLLPNLSHADWPGTKDTWHEYTRHKFQLQERNAYVVIPKQPAAGKPWVWRARFPDFHAEADRLLLERGFHIAYINTDGMLGSPNAMKIWDAFYNFMVKQDMSQKVALEGVSRGGLFVYGFATRWSERVACIYADTPVLDFKSWPAGKGTGKGHPATWQVCLKEYGFTEEQALAYQGNPIDSLAPIAAQNIPVLHIVSLDDQIVPPTENTFILVDRYRKLGGSIDVIEVQKGTESSNGHHFTHPDPKRVADFIQQHAMKDHGESR